MRARSCSRAVRSRVLSVVLTLGSSWVGLSAGHNRRRRGSCFPGDRVRQAMRGWRRDRTADTRRAGRDAGGRRRRGRHAGRRAGDRRARRPADPARRGGPRRPGRRRRRLAVPRVRPAGDHAAVPRGGLPVGQRRRAARHPDAGRARRRRPAQRRRRRDARRLGRATPRSPSRSARRARRTWRWSPRPSGRWRPASRRPSSATGSATSPRPSAPWAGPAGAASTPTRAVTASAGRCTRRRTCRTRAGRAAGCRCAPGW